MVRLLAIKSFFGFLEYENHILYDPTTKIELPRRRDALPTGIFTEDEINRMIGYVNIDKKLGLRDRAILEVLYSSGIRSRELASLDLYDLNREAQTLFIRRGKGGYSRTVPLGEIAMTYLAEYIRNERHRLESNKSNKKIFLSQKDGVPITPEWIPKIVKKYAKQIGITRYVCAHMIRSSAATHMLSRGAQSRYIQEYLGHRKLDTTQVYLKVNITDVKEVHKKTHPRELN